MSNVAARAARTLPPPGGKPFRLAGGARRGKFAARIGRRRLLTAALVAGDIVSGIMAIVAAAVIVAVVWPAGQVELAGWMQTEMWVLLLLLLGTNCSLGLYRSSFKSPIERFRLRAAATLLFAFVGMLMWIRAEPSVELAIVPAAG